MSTEYTQVFHTGEQWIEITYTPILNDEGLPTGHYKELSRKQIIVFGLFDNEVALQGAIDNITIFRNVTRNNLYALTGFNEDPIIIQAYSPNAQNLATVVIDYLKNNHLVVTSFQKFIENKHEKIEFECYVRELEGKPEKQIYKIVLKPFDNYVIRVT